MTHKGLRVGSFVAPIGCAAAFAGTATLVLSCVTEPRCHPPSHAVTPARRVSAPPIELAGVKLDASGAEVAARCAAQQGDFQGSAYCRPRPNAPGLGTEGSWQLLAWDARSNEYGQVKSIQAVYIMADTGNEEQMGSLISRITAVIGDPSSGSLAFCGRAARCDFEGYSEWWFEGGTVTLRAHQSAQSVELTLEHLHPDMTEKVIYGLGVCER